jgi:hypothetical protein
MDSVESSICEMDIILSGMKGPLKRVNPMVNDSEKSIESDYNQSSSSDEKKDSVIIGLQEPIKSFNPMDSDLESSVQLPEIVVPVLPAVAVVHQRKGRRRQRWKGSY